MADSKHTVYGTPGHHSWRAMIERCTNPKNHNYPNYGGRGIAVCKRWMDSFAAFLEDMGPRPSKSHTIDRIDGDGNYEPGNCRWATPKEQARNRRSNRMLTFRGKTKSVTEWSETTGISRSAIFTRLDALGYTVEEALTKPSDTAHRLRQRYDAVMLTCNGKTQSQADWARETGIQVTTICQRLRRGWSVEEAITTPSRR